jgi:heme-degrading monooxygenase HmoA
VIYRWKVPADNEAAFLACWKAATNGIHATTDGAPGSFCLQDLEEADEFLTVALWKTEAQWRRFIIDARAGSMRGLHALATQISAAPYRQFGDETVSD